MILRKRQRLAMALLVIACLLFQQVAMAAHACTMSQMPANPVVMAEDCAALASEPAQQPDAICQKHCAPDPTSSNTLAPLAVPALALPPISFELTLSEEPSHKAFASDVAFARSDPPPRVRYCRLLI